MSDETGRQGGCSDDSSLESVDRRSLLRLSGAMGGLLTLSGCTFLGSDDASDDEGTDGPSGNGDDDDSIDAVLSPQPGPSFLYEASATPPQFETAGVWTAESLLVSGTEAHVDGEYLYQGFANDDYGAYTDGSDPSIPAVQAPADLYSVPTGGLTYPTDAETFGHNAADPIEFRATPVEGGIRYRITLNTMLEPDVAGIAIGIDTDGEKGDEPDDWGYGLGTLGKLGLDHVLVTWGEGAELDGESVESSVDLARNQIEVRIPLEPDGETWRHYMVAGLFDTDAGRFREVLDEPTATNPGGANGRNPPPVFSVGFRAHEQEPLGGVDPTADAPADQLKDEAGDPVGFWRDHAQAQALAARDISAFFADIDFETLENGTTERDLPGSGYLNLLYGSRYNMGDGVEVIEADDESESVVRMTGRVQPYTVYIPESAADEDESKVHLHMHSSTANYNQYGVSSPNALRQLGEERDAIVLTPQGRGPQIGYGGIGGVDVLEALSALDSRFGVDFQRLSLGGYSLGGFGTFDIAGRYPDLFTRGFTVVAAHTDDRLLDNLRHVPLCMWNAVEDETVPIELSDRTHDALRDRGYRHRYAKFPEYGHLTLSGVDQWDNGRAFLDGEFLGDDAVENAPAQVTFHRSPDLELPDYDFIHTGAYWVDDVEVADDSDSGRIDAFSAGFGEARPETATIEGERTGAGTQYGYTQLEWTESDVDAENRLEIELDGVTSATIYVDEAGLDASEPIELAIESTHEAELVLESGAGTETVSVTAGESSNSVRLG